MQKQPEFSLTARSWKQVIPVLVVALVFSCLPAQAQSTFGTIVGTVTDATGAVVPGARVEAQEQSTAVQRSVQSDQRGDYQFLNMDPGTYTITVSAQNFATVKNEGVVLPARETMRADFKLTGPDGESASGGHVEARSGQRGPDAIQFDVGPAN